MNRRRKILLLALIQLLLCQTILPATAGTRACDQKSVSKSNLFVECLTEESINIATNEILKRLKLGKTFNNTGGFNPKFYPAETLLEVVKARNSVNNGFVDSWLETEIKRLRTEIRNTNYFLIHPTSGSQRVFGENSQARLVLGLANIYAIYPNKDIENLLVNTYFALNSLPLIVVNSTVTNNSFRLPAYIYENPIKPKANSGRTLDPNHEATLAAAYLQVSRSGVLSKSDSAQALKNAKNYFYAGLDLVIEDKCLALADQPTFIDSCDTRYNAFWLHWMLVAQPYLGNPSTLITLRNQYYVMKKQITNFSTLREYPFRYNGKYPDPVEPITLLNSVAKFGSKSEFLNFVSKLNHYYLQNSKYSSAWPTTFLMP
jgi:hypothetical protein